MEAFLERILTEITGPILPIEDCASCHVPHTIKDLTEAECQLEILLSPSHGPEANTIQDLWRLLKDPDCR